MNDVSIIIVSYNSQNVIRECIKSIYDNTKNIYFEIIVIDNNSEDNTIDIIKKELPGINLITNTENIGFGAANNYGIKRSASKYILLLNPDTFLINDAISILYSFMETNEDSRIWCCGAKVLDKYYNPSKSFGKYTSVAKIFFEQFGFHRIFKKFYYKKLLEVQKNFDNKEGKVPFIIGADMFIKREYLEKIGFFDEDFDLNFEEAELSFRASKLGLISFIVPEAEIIHYAGFSFTNKEQQWFFYRKNEILFSQKCFLPLKYYTIKIIYIMGTVVRIISGFNEYDILLLKYLFGRDSYKKNSLFYKTSKFKN